MAFGQASGSPAPAKLVRELLDLLEAAGHSDFRDARGPMGFNQRQAAGKFTRDEAQAYIDQLQEEAAANGDAPAPPPPSSRIVARPEERSPRPAGAARPATGKVVARPVERPSARPAPRPAARPSAGASGPSTTLRGASDEQLLAEVARRGLTLPSD
jgi:hypothetical protein